MAKFFINLATLVLASAFMAYVIVQWVMFP